MITSQNISAYINYLHQQRLGIPAAQSLLDKWHLLPNHEIQLQLKNLYHHWNLNEQAAKIHEQNFLSFNNPRIVEQAKAPFDEREPKAETVNIAPKKSSLLWSILSVIIIGGAIGLCIYLWSAEGKSVESSVATNTASEPSINHQISEPPVAINPTNNSEDTNSSASTTDTTIGTNIDTSISIIDKQNFMALQSLFDAEVSQDFEQVARFYSPTMKRYWDLDQPQIEDLQSRYEHLWTKISNPVNKDLKVSKVGEKKYRITGVFQYFHVDKQKDLSTTINTVFEFDDDGKIIYANKAN
jgi:hypothetical protein